MSQHAPLLCFRLTKLCSTVAAAVATMMMACKTNSTVRKVTRAVGEVALFSGLIVCALMIAILPLVATPGDEPIVSPDTASYLEGLLTWLMVVVCWSLFVSVFMISCHMVGEKLADNA